MELIHLKTEDFSKKSSSNLLKIITELNTENQRCQSEMGKLLDYQDEIFEIYNKIMRIIAQRSHN